MWSYVLGFATGVALVRLFRGDWVIGGVSWNAADLQRRIDERRPFNGTVIGGAVIAGDVTPEQALAAIHRLLVVGGLVAPAQVLDALGERIIVIGGSAGK